jgi:hypothetical protein
LITPLDPENLTTAASLNRLCIVDLPGLDPALKGKTGYDLLSTKALLNRLYSQADKLNLPMDGNVEDRELPRLFNTCFDDPKTRHPAERIASSLGHNLGYILLTLARGDEVNRAGRADWDDSYWSYWGKIRKVILGGGLSRGKLGIRLQQYALDVLHESGFHDYVIEISPYGSALPLVGAARYIPPGSASALVFDFGGTFVKRACAIYENDALIALCNFPSLPSGCESLDPSLPEVEQAEEQRDYMLSVIERTWLDAENAGYTPSPAISISVASYLRDGHPFDRGCYGQLRLISEHLQSTFAEDASKIFDQPIQTKLLHDGTAAATTYSGSPHTAVLMLGTAIGIGFPTAREGLRSLGREQIDVIDV